MTSSSPKTSPVSDMIAPAATEFETTVIDRRVPVRAGWKPIRGRPPLLRLPGVVASLAGLAFKRLRYHSGLSLLALLGVTLAVGLVTSASFFAQAVDQVIMRQEMAEYSRITKRPPFATRVYTFSSPQDPLSLARAEQLGQHVAGTLTGEVGLPVKSIVLQMRAPIAKLQAQPGSGQYQGKRSLGEVHLLYMEGVEDYLNIVAGAPMVGGASTETLSVWMHTALAEKMGVQIGETFDLLIGPNRALLPIQLKGFWQPQDPADPFWFGDPDVALQPLLLVSRQDYLTQVEPLLPARGRSATWNIVFDELKAIPAQGRRYVTGFERGQIIINKYLPEARLTDPSISLEKFVQRQTTLTILLLGFNIPAFGFLLYFLILTSVVIAYWQRRETAVMVGRGMSISNILNFTLIEELLLFVVGCPLGLLFGVLLARLMGDTVSFLSFISRAPLPISWRGINLPLTLITLGVVLIARLWPAALAARQSVLQQEREHARPLRPPFWYRTYLDLLLIIPTAYAYRQLMDRGTLALLVRDRPEDLYRDPLLILVPALFIITMSLVAMRLFPLLMRLLDALAGLTPWTPVYLALRQLGRQGHTYINPLLLVIVCLALGIYTMSMAASLDQWLIDRMYYQAGADLAFEPYLESEALAEIPGGAVGAEWIPPQDEFKALPGVVAAARLGNYPMEMTLLDGRELRGRFLAVDRVEFPQVAWFRDDFAAEPLGSLMNRLASSPDSILVPQQFLAENHLQIGDSLKLEVVVDFGASVISQFTIAGAYQYFPTVYEDKIAVIGNLEHLFSFFGLTMPHQIWLRAQAGAEGKTILQAVTTTGIETIRERDARGLIREEQA